MFKPDKLPPPSCERMTVIALRILEEALAEKERGKVKRTLSHRLALAWIAHCGIGLEWHHRKFWTELADEHLNVEIESYRKSARTQHLTSLLNYWWYDIGHEPPDADKRAEWAGKQPKTMFDRI